VTKVDTFYLSDRGRVRQHNEDCVGVFENEVGVLAIVADGMGGHLAGDVASQMTISTFKELWEQVKNIDSPKDAESWFIEKVSEVNKTVYDHSLSNPECQGMGTTIVGAIITPSFATIGHIGDSRCYLLNNSGYKQVTQDHSLVNELVRSGQISKEDAEHHPRKNVLLRALGTEQTVELDVSTIEFEQEDVLLLCSDGLSNKVSDEEMQEEMLKGRPLPDIANSLVQSANANGGEDNISLVIIKKTANLELGEAQC
jgi:protein phosphatase